MIADTLSLHKVKEVRMESKWYRKADGSDTPFECRVFTFVDAEGSWFEVTAFMEADDGQG